MNKLNIEKDAFGKKLTVTRYFNATPEQVWRAWTEKELLDQWWAPKPYQAQTKTLEFVNGGTWLYAMAGPEGDKNWCKVEFKNIVPGKSFDSIALFSDENGVTNDIIPAMHWTNTFYGEAAGTKVVIEVSFATEEGLKAIVEMGFQEGFASAMENLDQIFSQQ
ncbi:uncharacterized protein YndB with AHSA1/START domain [Filimonas zeae]|uniref:Activator of HSP90 ATPase n=1 Tax=Filimonas zeae TaxID=1737353 RepID=A0A917MX40_9BACT|nr:SRPBCC domain-containing protein [Filimonas zeae]MDR6340596.1 uncharacterized protein YndB with AHSA1/START domain [Filimonas zeae]GGH73470.1 activator of HSP90 ATPase [Filimonas zeae]